MFAIIKNVDSICCQLHASSVGVNCYLYSSLFVCPINNLLPSKVELNAFNLNTNCHKINTNFLVWPFSFCSFVLTIFFLSLHFQFSFVASGSLNLSQIKKFNNLLQTKQMPFWLIQLWLICYTAIDTFLQ